MEDVPDDPHWRAGLLTMADESEWTSAWDDREYFTYGPVPSSGTIDPGNPTMDGDGNVHVAYECWETSDSLGPMDLGYKAEGTPRWAVTSPAFKIHPGGPSPKMWVQRSSPESVHVTWGGSDSTHAGRWVRHTVRSLGDPGNDSTWAAKTWATGVFASTELSVIHPETAGSPPIVVDSSSRVHFFGKVLHRHAQATDSTYVLHASGFHSASDNWASSVDTLDVFTKPNGDPDPDDPIDPGFASMPGVLATSLDRGDEVIDVVWGHRISFSDSTREVYYSEIDATTNEPSLEVPITPLDGVSSRGLALARTADGRLHFMYQDWIAPSTTVIFYRYSDDPPDSAAWSIPEPVTPDVSNAVGPSFAVEADSLRVIFHTSASAWYRKGWSLGNEVASGDTTTWSGLVYLDRDFVVDSGGTLLVDPGTQIMAESDTDSANVGRDSTRVELIVRGTLKVNGATDSTVTFESTEGGEGDWGGILFDLAASQSGYGFTCPSSISHANVKDAGKGIAIRQTGAPSLNGVTFTNVVGNQHVVLDSSDVYVPYLGAWSLTAPTRVKAAMATRSGAEIGNRNPGKVDLVVHGELNTSSTDQSRVLFEPMIVPGSGSGTDGDAWGGIFFDWPSAGSTFTDADVGYALTPVSLYYQNAEVANARIHHFKDRGIWIYARSFVGDGGPWVHASHVFRDTTGTATLAGDLGRKGIVIEKCRLGAIEENVVELQGVDADELAGFGIHVVNGKTWCTQSSSDPDSIKIIGNEIIGPGGSLSIENYGSWSGLRGDYPCAASPHVALVKENVFTGWNLAGIDFSQGIDVQVSCNRVANCRKGVEFTRTETQGPEVRFRTNALKVPAYGIDGDQQVIRTDDALKARFGPSVSTALNNIVAVGKDWFIFENDEGAADTLNAVDNYWERDGTVYTFPLQIRQYISKDSWVSDAKRVDPSSANSDSSTCAPEGQMAHDRGVHLVAETPGAVVTGTLGLAGLPARTELSLSGAMPARAKVDVRFDLAGAERRPVTVEVYDVSGRRVKRLVASDLSGGRYGLTWGGVSEDGHAVGAGVYFIRFQAGAVTQVRKAVLLR